MLLSASGLFIFLAYATTGSVARQLGAGSRAGALARGLDGVWLATGLGMLVAAVVAGYAAPLAGLFGATEAVHEQAVSYLRVGALGLPAMLVTLAATGTLRGMLDTRTPLLVSVAGFTGNAGLTLLFVRGFGWGIAGSAWATVIAHTAMATGLVAVVRRGARQAGVSSRPRPGRVLAAARGGLPLVVRTVALRSILLVAVWAAARLGEAPLAAHQIVATVWSVLAFTVDALAIAAQAVIGRELGAGRVAAARAATATMLRWGAGTGVLLGALVASTSQWWLPLFSPDPRVRELAAAALVVVGAGQLVAGYVFVADGVLMGAGDFGYLAVAMLATLAAYLVVVLAVPAAGGGLTQLWAAFVVMMLVRGGTLWARLRGDRWAVTGVG